MGDIADDIADGFMCTWCGTCFEKDHGYPVLCKACQEGTTPEEMKELGLQPAEHKEL